MRKIYIIATEENEQFILPALEKVGGTNIEWLWNENDIEIGDCWFIKESGAIDAFSLETPPPSGYTEVFLDSSGNIIESTEPSLKDKYRSEIIEPALKSTEPSEIDVKSDYIFKREIGDGQFNSKTEDVIFSGEFIKALVMSYINTIQHNDAGFIKLNEGAIVNDEYFRKFGLNQEYVSEVKSENEKLRTCLREFVRINEGNGNLMEFGLIDQAKQLLK